MTQDEKNLRTAIAEWNKAFERKDSAALTKDYLSDCILFDCKPPYKIVGQDAIKHMWDHCLPYMPEKFTIEVKDEKLVVDGNMAYLHALHHMHVEGESNHPACQTWLRVTVIYRKVNGAWKVAHEHVSVPFNPMNNHAAFITDVDDVLCGVDYTATCE